MAKVVMNEATRRDAVIAYAEALSLADFPDQQSLAMIEEKSAELVAQLFSTWPKGLPVRKKKVVVVSETKDQDSFARPMVSLLEAAEAKVSVVDFQSSWNQTAFCSEALPSVADVLVFTAPTLDEANAFALAGIALRVKPEAVVLLTPAYRYADFSNLLADVSEIIGSSSVSGLKIDDATLLGVDTEDFPSRDEDIDSEIAYAADVIRDCLSDYRDALDADLEEINPYATYSSKFVASRNARALWCYPEPQELQQEPDAIEGDDLEDMLERYRPAATTGVLTTGLMDRARMKQENMAAARRNTLAARMVRWLGFGANA